MFRHGSLGVSLSEMSRDSNSPLVAMTMIDDVRNTINKGKLWLLRNQLHCTNWVFQQFVVLHKLDGCVVVRIKLEVFPAAGSE